MESIPEFCDLGRVGTLFYPDVSGIANDAARRSIAPSAEDAYHIHLLIIDMQVDFCHTQGSLHVPGAADDIKRLIRFIYTHASKISHITCSLDSHYPFQIFHPAWWVNAGGDHPSPFTVITSEDVMEKRWIPVIETEWSRRYVIELNAQAKKDLVIWPYHVPIGSVGNALDPELWSAVFWHSLARRYQPTLWTKGSIPKTEHYSILKPEIEVPEHPHGGVSREFLDLLGKADHIFIAGEAETHCVLETVEDLVEAFGTDPESLSKITILRDCMSPVIHPDVDFHALAVKQFRKYEEAGIRFMNSTDPLPV